MTADDKRRLAAVDPDARPAARSLQVGLNDDDWAALGHNAEREGLSRAEYARACMRIGGAFASST